MDFILVYLLLTTRFDEVWSAPPIRSQSMRPLTQGTSAIEKRTSHHSSSSSSSASLTAEQLDPLTAEKNIEISQNIEGENAMTKSTYMSVIAKQSLIIAISAAITYTAINYQNNSFTTEPSRNVSELHPNKNTIETTQNTTSANGNIENEFEI